MTKHKALLLSILRSDKCHHTAEELFNMARAENPSISRATIYNNLHALERERLIRKISGDGGPDRYDGAYIPHAHLVCTVCGKVSDVEVFGIESSIAKALGYQAEAYELKIKARCAECESI